jgi:hypothetical protein
MGEVISLATCSPELQDQFVQTLGPEFSVRALVGSLKERSLFHEARGAINSFLPADYDIKAALTRTHEGVYFSSRCEPDKDEYSETADFSLAIDDVEPPYTEQASIQVSPNALLALYAPVFRIADTLLQDGEKEANVDTLANIVYRAVYAKTVGQFVIMKNVFPNMDNPEAMERFKSVADRFYEAKFGQDGIDDFVVRLDRLAMMFGGSIMLRNIATNMDQVISKQPGTQVVRIGQMLKMYTAGLQSAKPVDQQRVTFPLAHAFIAKEVPQFIKAWFS